MTLTQLEYIVAVDTYKSFSAAAEKCFVTQPTLSMQIQKLEDELSVDIFDRQKKPILTTQAGAIIVEQARKTLHEAKEIKMLADEGKDELSGTYTIGVIPTVAPYLLPLFLPSILAEFPKLKLKIEELTTDEIVAKLKNETIDAGILATPLNLGGMNELPLYKERMLVYVSSHSPYFFQDSINLHQVSSNEMWLLKQGHCLRNQVVNLCSKIKDNPELYFHFESGSIETLIRLVDVNGGMTLVPEMAKQYLSRDKKKCLKEAANGNPGRQISLVTRRLLYRKKITEQIQETIQQIVPGYMKHEQIDIIPID